MVLDLALESPRQFCKGRFRSFEFSEDRVPEYQVLTILGENRISFVDLRTGRYVISTLIRYL